MPNFSAQCVKGVQGIGYVCAFLLSLAICVPMSMQQDQFKGRCLLFSTGTWQEKDGQLKVDWASQAYCNFTIFVSVIMFVISLFQFVRFLKFFYKGRDSTFLSAFVDVIVCVFMTVMTLTAALFVTLGFKIWCEVIIRRFANCSDAVGDVIARSEGIDSSGFFNQIFTAQFGIWTSFTVWFTLLVFSMVKLCRYHHEENLRVSMAKERKRLINEDLVSEVPNVGGGSGSRHRKRFNVRGRTGGESAAAESAAAATSSSSGVVVVVEASRGGHEGPLDDEVPVVAVVDCEKREDALFDAAVQKQIQQRLEREDSNNSPNHSECSASGVPSEGFADHSSDSSTGGNHQQIHGNQIRVEAHGRSDSPWY